MSSGTILAGTTYRVLATTRTDQAIHLRHNSERVAQEQGQARAAATPAPSGHTTASRGRQLNIVV